MRWVGGRGEGSRIRRQNGQIHEFDQHYKVLLVIHKHTDCLKHYVYLFCPDLTELNIHGCRMISWPSRPCYSWTWSSLWELMIHHRSENLEGAWVFSCPSCVMMPLWPLSLYLALFPLSLLYIEDGKDKLGLLSYMESTFNHEYQEQVSLSLILKSFNSILSHLFIYRAARFITGFKPNLISSFPCEALSTWKFYA